MNKPILIIGPSGSGKTTLANTIAKLYPFHLRVVAQLMLTSLAVVPPPDGGCVIVEEAVPKNFPKILQLVNYHPHVMVIVCAQSEPSVEITEAFQCFRLTK